MDSGSIAICKEILYDRHIVTTCYLFPVHHYLLSILHFLAYYTRSSDIQKQMYL